jgi:nucleotide-binding universal stress UspA family protein
MPFPEQVTRDVSPDGGVVVGDDGSAGAGRAVRYAAEEARRRGTTLHVLRAWTIVSAPRPDDLPAGIAASMTELEAATRAAEEARVADLLGDPPPTPVEVHTCHGPPAQSLLKAAETADVVVVGSRGRGGFASLVLGSVAEQVVRHSAAPVIVVR